MFPFGRAAALGAISGVAGAAGMAAAAKVEQRFTHRPDSYVPAHTLAHLLGLKHPDADLAWRNVTMHYATGALVGVVRGTMAAANLRGPLASAMFTNLRLSVDQTLENATGVGAPPWTWPRDELLVDVALKAGYALITGAIADGLIPPAPTSSARRRGLNLRLKGFA
jgi:hypothetical protein